MLVVHESLVCSEQLNWALFFRQILQVLQILQFSSIFCIFEPFPAVTIILRSIFSHWGQLMDSNTTIKKGSNIQWCSRRTHDALRAGRWKHLNRIKMSKYFLFCWNIIFFPFSTALRKQQKILACFPEDKLSTIYLDLQIQKVFTPWKLKNLQDLEDSFWRTVLSLTVQNKQETLEQPSQNKKNSRGSSR